MEAAKVPIMKMSKMCVCLCAWMYAMEYHSDLKMKEIMIHAIIRIELENTKWNKPITKGQILYDSTYMRYERSQIQRRKTEQWLQGLGRGEVDG